MKNNEFLSFQEFKKQYQEVEIEEYFSQVSSEVTVSICVITYQHSQYIRQCLDSILEQETSFEYEILVGDDASTDGTREICKEYADKYPDKIRLLLHSRENNISLYGKPSGRFNFLYNIFTSKGKYIALCEGDDYWTDPLKLQKQFDAMEAHTDCSACFTAAKVVTEDSDSEDFIFRPTDAEKRYKYSIYDSPPRIGGFMPTASVFFRKKYVSTLPKWIIDSPAGDLPLTLILGDQGYYYYIDEPMVVYRSGVMNSWSADQKNYSYRRKVLKGISKTILDFNQYSKNKYFFLLIKEVLRIRKELFMMFIKNMLRI